MKQGWLSEAPSCPCCSAKLDGFTDPISDASPSPGDVTICFYCGGCLRFIDNLQLAICIDPPKEIRPLLTELQRALKTLKNERR